MSYRELLDRPIAFQRVFTKLNIGITGALMLSQAVFWSNRQADVDGWFYKTMDEWNEETGLSVKEQATARSKLRALGILEEVKKGVPCKIYFRVNFDNLEKELTKVIGKASFAESANLGSTNEQTSVSRNGKPITKNYTKNIPLKPLSGKNKKNTVTVETMLTSVRGLSEKTAQEYFDYRKGKRKPLTDRAWKGISKALNEFIAIGGTPDQALNKAMEKDWIGLESEWLQRLFYPNVSQFKLPEQQEKIPAGMSKTKVEGWFNDGLGYWKDPKLFDEMTGNSWYTVYLSDKRRVPVEMIPAFEAKRYGGSK